MRDEIIKYGIMSGNKTVIDIGTDSTKVLEVSYTAKEINIEQAYLLKVGYSGEESFREIAGKVEEMIDRVQKRYIIIVLPSNLTENKI